jgi:hypothetical protein
LIWPQKELLDAAIEEFDLSAKPMCAPTGRGVSKTAGGRLCELIH